MISKLNIQQKYLCLETRKKKRRKNGCLYLCVNPIIKGKCNIVTY